MLEYLFNKVAGFLTCNLIKKKLQHTCLPVNLANILTFEKIFDILLLNNLFVSLIEVKNSYLRFPAPGPGPGPCPNLYLDGPSPNLYLGAVQ